MRFGYFVAKQSNRVKLPQSLTATAPSKREPNGRPQGSPLQEVVGWFKTMVTNEYIKGVKNNIYSPFNKKLWQRGYFEHIIRNEQELYDIRKYIEENPIKWETDDYYIN